MFKKADIRRQKRRLKRFMEELELDDFLNDPPLIKTIDPIKKLCSSCGADLNTGGSFIFDQGRIVCVSCYLKSDVQEKFIINPYLTVKLEAAFTNIYVAGELFQHCKYLLLTIPTDDTSKIDEIHSMDEAMALYSHKEERGVTTLDPRTEFIGHCSNLQVWYEHKYNTDLLDSRLAFPLLKRLTLAGDPLAQRVFKEEIARRLASGFAPTIEYLLQQNYLSFFSRDELSSILDGIENRDSVARIKHMLFKIDCTLNFEHDNVWQTYHFNIDDKGVWSISSAFLKKKNKTIPITVIKEAFKLKTPYPSLPLCRIDKEIVLHKRDMYAILERYEFLRDEYRFCSNCKGFIPVDIASVLTTKGTHICSGCITSYIGREQKVLSLKKLSGPLKEQEKLKEIIKDMNRIMNITNAEVKASSIRAFHFFYHFALFSLIFGLGFLTHNLFYIISTGFFSAGLFILFQVYFYYFYIHLTTLIHEKYPYSEKIKKRE